jgi:hypothetical protein
MKRAAAVQSKTMTASPDIDWQAIEPAFTPEYVAGLRRMTGVQKLEVASALYRTALAVKMAGLRRRHAQWDETRLRHEATRAILLSNAMA